MGEEHRQSETFAVLSGLVEGPVPPIEHGEQHLREWVAFAASNGLKFDLTIEGPSFNLLADQAKIPCAPQASIQGRVQECVDQLLRVFPQDLWHSISSTLRSEETHGREKIQSVYLFTPEGVEVKSRKSIVERRPPEKSGFDAVSLKKYVPLGIFCVVLFFLFVGSLFILDYSEVWSSLRSKYKLTSEAQFEVDGKGIDRYIEIGELELNKRKTGLVLEVRRTERFPTSAREFLKEKRRLETGSDLQTTLAFQKIVVEGSVRVEYFDKDGERIADFEAGTRGLLKAETVSLSLPVQAHPSTVKVVLSF